MHGDSDGIRLTIMDNTEMRCGVCGDLGFV